MRCATVLLAGLLAGCAGTREPGVVTLSAIDSMGRNPRSFNFALLDRETGQVVWSAPSISTVVLAGIFRKKRT